MSRNLADFARTLLAGGIIPNATPSADGLQSAADKTKVDAAPLIVRTAEVATTSRTAVDWTDLPSDVSEIHIKARNVSQNGSDHFIVQLGDAGGIEDTGYASRAMLYFSIGVVGYSSPAGFILSPSEASTPDNFTMTIRRVGNTNLWVASGVQARTAAVAGGVFTGEKTLSGTLDRVRLRLTAAATMNGGAVSLDYVRSS
jgi:hypothetical protein